MTFSVRISITLGVSTIKLNTEVYCREKVHFDTVHWFMSCPSLSELVELRVLYMTSPPPEGLVICPFLKELSKMRRFVHIDTHFPLFDGFMCKMLLIE